MEGPISMGVPKVEGMTSVMGESSVFNIPKDGEVWGIGQTQVRMGFRKGLAEGFYLPGRPKRSTRKGEKLRL